MVEPDHLTRHLVGPAIEALGFRVRFASPQAATAEPGRAGGGHHQVPAAAFIPLEPLLDCRRLRAAVGPPGASEPLGASDPLLVGYGRGSSGLLAAHRAHRCCDLVLRLAAGESGEPQLEHLPAADAVRTAGLSVREADVLVLLLHGLSTTAVAARLGVAASTARTHSRAVLLKLGQPDRRALRAALGTPQVCRDPGVSFGQEWPVAVPLAALHT